MNQAKLVPFLDHMGSAFIDTMNINLKQDTITLYIKPLHDMQCQPIEITFEEVAAFYYLDEHTQSQSAHQRFNEHLNSISFYRDGFGQFAAVEVVDDEENPLAVSYPNFVVTMLDRSLLIEARTVKINGQAYRVGYPKN